MSYKFICKILGHKWLYNFLSLPDKCICKRCGHKAIYDYKTMTWIEIDRFSKNMGSDKEIKKRWKKYNR